MATLGLSPSDSDQEIPVCQAYDGAPFDKACADLALLLSGTEGETANTVRRLFIDHPQVFYAVVFYTGAASRVGTSEGVARLCLEPSVRFNELAAAVAANQFDVVRAIDHDIRSLAGVATPG